MMTNVTDDEKREQQQSDRDHPPCEATSSTMDATTATAATDVPPPKTLENGSLEVMDTSNNNEDGTAYYEEEAGADDIMEVAPLKESSEASKNDDDENPTDVPAQKTLEDSLEVMDLSNNNDTDGAVRDGEKEGADDADSKEEENDARSDDDDENPDVPDESPLAQQTEIENGENSASANDDANEKVNGNSGLGGKEPEPLSPADAPTKPSPNNAHPKEDPVKISKPEDNTAQLLESEDPTSECIDNSCNEVDQYVHCVGNNNEANDGGIDNGDEADDHGDFVAIELASPKHAPTEQSPKSTLDHPTTCEFGLSDPDDADFVKAAAAAPDAADTFYFNTIPTNSTSNAATTNNPLPSPPPRRKILRHPFLTPLTQLPWDRWVSAAGSCDLLFNCKYSMRQVEDEVREEHKKTNGDFQLENGGEGDRVGREDGYVNLSLGNECGDFDYGEDEGCNADEFAELGLGCCSMLDGEVEEEVEVVMTDGNGEDGQWEQVDNEQVGGEGVQQLPNSQDGKGDVHHEQIVTSSTPAHSPSLLSDEQRAEASWKSSYPSLDMMLYRTMINE